MPAALGEAAEAANSLVVYRMLAGAGHSMHRDSYEAMWEALQTWL